MKDLGKYDKVAVVEEEEEQEMDAGEEMDAPDCANTSQTRQLLLVYLIVFAEA